MSNKNETIRIPIRAFLIKKARLKNQGITEIIVHDLPSTLPFLCATEDDMSPTILVLSRTEDVLSEII